MTPRYDFGSLNEPLSRTPGGRNVLGSVGPVSDAFIVGADDVAVIEGPQGSGKTTSAIKKALLEAQRILPGPDGVRRYVLGVFREKYDNLWKATIPSYWTVLKKDLPGSTWIGSSPRAASHVVRFQDHYGPIEMHVHFLAFGDAGEPEDLRGQQYTDVYLNEIDTLPENLFTYLVGRVGRDPPRSIIRRTGRIWGDMNAPDVLSWTFRDLHETLRPGYCLYRQPGGRDPGAENLDAMGREYYEHQARVNAHRPWWVRRMVDNLPGFSRDTDLVYASFDDIRMVASAQLAPLRELPVLVGIDGGLTPAAVYMQEIADGQLRIYAEVVLERGGMRELADAMLAVEVARFRGCDFVYRCDPAMIAGEDTEDGSERRRLGKHLGGRPIKPARVNNNDIDARVGTIRAKIALNLDGGRPGLILDPACRALRRGFNQTYHFRRLRTTHDRASIEKTPDSHPHDALGYGATECGTAEARRRMSEVAEARAKRMAEARAAPRYSPFRRRRA